MTSQTSGKRRIRPLMIGLSFLAAFAGIGYATATLGVESSAPASPDSGLRRLTEAQYRQTIADVFGDDIKVVGRFEPDLRVGGLLAVGTSAVSITPGGIEQYEAIARTIAAQVTDDVHFPKLVGCENGGGDAKGARCAAAFFTRIGMKLYRRPLFPAEVRQAVASTLAASDKLGGFRQGLAATLTGMLTSPDFLFRIDNPMSRLGAVAMVDGWSKASRLSYFLWNTTPDDALLAAAGRGDLDTPEGLAREVDRMIASPRFVTGVRAFFSDFLQLEDIDNLSKDTLIYPAFTSTVAMDAREQTLRTIVDLLVTRRGDYRDLFTTRRMAMNRTLGPLYSVPVAPRGWSTYEFPADDPRAGILTQLSFLALHSHPGRTSPTLRGKAMREIFMCEHIPAPPANVNFAVVQDVNNPTLRTTRERLKAHLDDEECASCHRLTDPIGLGLEKFDGAGQFREAEHDVAIDVTGDLDKVKFDGAAQLGQLFHDSPKISSCAVETAWRYATGRNLTAYDRPIVDALNAGFGAHGYRMVDLIRAIALNPAFYSMIRTPPAPQKTAGATVHGKEDS